LFYCINSTNRERATGARASMADSIDKPPEIPAAPPEEKVLVITVNF